MFPHRKVSPFEECLGGSEKNQPRVMVRWSSRRWSSDEVWWSSRLNQRDPTPMESCQPLWVWGNWSEIWNLWPKSPPLFLIVVRDFVRPVIIGLQMLFLRSCPVKNYPETRKKTDGALPPISRRNGGTLVDLNLPHLRWPPQNHTIAFFFAGWRKIWRIWTQGPVYSGVCNFPAIECICICGAFLLFILLGTR